MMAENPHILVVDDDTRLRDLLSRFLSENGFVTSAAPDAKAARRLLAGITFDLIVLDVMMPGEDGLAFTEWVRDGNDVPILLLTARGEVEDRIAGLERGADDYLAKPFEPRELLLRIATILRRAGGNIARTPKDLFRFGDCTFDLARCELQRNGSPVRLTTMEETLLRALVVRAGEAVSREALIDEIGIEGESRVIDVQVTRLRRKIEPDPREPRYLQTVRGLGYILRPD
jgi:two-component system phosphate regulon response regulator OmpR